MTASNQTTLGRYDAAVDALLRMSDDVSDAWDATVADDPGFALGQIGRAYLRCWSTEAADAADARRILDRRPGLRLR